MSDVEPIAVIGAGNWGTAVAQLLARQGRPVRLWTRKPDTCEQINRTHQNPRSSLELVLAASVRATTDIGDATRGASLVLVMIPSQAFREVCRQLGAVLVPEQLVIHGTKGLELGSLRRMSEILQEESCARQIGVLSGPNIAAEVAQGKPCGSVVASAFPAVIAAGRRALTSEQLLIFGSNDVLGVELCGALKNVIAIAAGMAEAMGVGENAKAFLITRGAAELMDLVFAMGAEPLTLAGLAGIGDLIVTCSSPLSRNHRIGVALARGQSLQEAMAGLGMVAEGVYASRAAAELARAYGVEMPLFERVRRILYEGLSPAAALAELMQLSAGRERPHFQLRRPPQTW